MDYFLLANLLVKVGYEATDFIIKRQAANGVVTEADWASLQPLIAKNAQSQVEAGIAALALDPNDPHVAAVLAMAKAAKV
jgi:hypothetical protein